MEGWMMHPAIDGIHPSIYELNWIHLPSTHLSIHPVIHPFVRPSIYPYINPYIHAFTHLCLSFLPSFHHPSINIFSLPSIHPFLIHPSFCRSFQPLLRTFRPSIFHYTRSFLSPLSTLFLLTASAGGRSNTCPSAESMAPHPLWSSAFINKWTVAPSIHLL